MKTYTKPRTYVSNIIISSIRRHPLVAYFILAYVLAWVLIPLVVSVSVAFGLLALFGPAIAAIIVTAVVEGRAGVKQLLQRVVPGRTGWKWVAVTVGLPILISAMVVALNAMLLGKP